MNGARRRLSRIARLAAGCLLTAAVAGPTAHAALLPDFYGINAGGAVFNASPADRDMHLEKMRRSGITLLRIDASWNGAEPTSPAENGGVHVYEWAGFDTMVTAMASHGLRWYPMLGYSAPWSGQEVGNLFSGPADPADYAAYVSAFAVRYGRNGAFWQAHPDLPYLPTLSYEIWNEPNFDMFWSRQEDAPERYADLYLAARAAVHAVDGAADAVVGGLIDSDAEPFVARMYAHRPDLRGNVDALGFHPYRQDGGVIATVRRMRRQLDRVGAGDVPIELSEIGWYVGGFTDAARVRLMGRLPRALRRSGLNVTRFMPYVWIDNRWGMINPDGTPLPIGAAYLNAIAADFGPQRSSLGSAAVRTGR